MTINEVLLLISGRSSAIAAITVEPAVKYPFTVNSLVSGHPLELKKCSLIILSAYEKYSHKRTPQKNRVDVRLRKG